MDRVHHHQLVISWDEHLRANLLRLEHTVVAHGIQLEVYVDTGSSFSMVSAGVLQLLYEGACRRDHHGCVNCRFPVVNVPDAEALTFRDVAGRVQRLTQVLQFPLCHEQMYFKVAAWVTTYIPANVLILGTDQLYLIMRATVDRLLQTTPFECLEDEVYRVTELLDRHRPQACFADAPAIATASRMASCSLSQATPTSVSCSSMATPVACVKPMASKKASYTQASVSHWTTVPADTSHATSSVPSEVFRFQPTSMAASAAPMSSTAPSTNCFDNVDYDDPQRPDRFRSKSGLMVTRMRPMSENPSVRLTPRKQAKQDARQSAAAVTTVSASATVTSSAPSSSSRPTVIVLSATTHVQQPLANMSSVASSTTSFATSVTPSAPAAPIIRPPTEELLRQQQLHHPPLRPYSAPTSEIGTDDVTICNDPAQRGTPLPNRFCHHCRSQLYCSDLKHHGARWRECWDYAQDNAGGEIDARCSHRWMYHCNAHCWQRCLGCKRADRIWEQYGGHMCLQPQGRGRNIEAEQAYEALRAERPVPMGMGDAFWVNLLNDPELPADSAMRGFFQEGRRLQQLFPDIQPPLCRPCITLTEFHLDVAKHVDNLRYKARHERPTAVASARTSMAAYSQRAPLQPINEQAPTEDWSSEVPVRDRESSFRGDSQMPHGGRSRGFVGRSEQTARPPSSYSRTTSSVQQSPPCGSASSSDRVPSSIRSGIPVTAPPPTHTRSDPTVRPSSARGHGDSVRQSDTAPDSDPQSGNSSPDRVWMLDFSSKENQSSFLQKPMLSLEGVTSFHGTVLTTWIDTGVTVSFWLLIRSGTWHSLTDPIYNSADTRVQEQFVCWWCFCQSVLPASRTIVCLISPHPESFSSQRRVVSASTSSTTENCPMAAKSSKVTDDTVCIVVVCSATVDSPSVAIKPIRIGFNSLDLFSISQGASTSVALDPMSAISLIFITFLRTTDPIPENRRREHTVSMRGVGSQPVLSTV